MAAMISLRTAGLGEPRTAGLGELRTVGDLSERRLPCRGEEGKKANKNLQKTEKHNGHKRRRLLFL